MNHPSALRNVQQRRLLTLAWADGSCHSVSHARLRAACPCAQCRAARLGGRIDLVHADVLLREINLQGYGVQLGFDDGHERGIYPWSYLRELCSLDFPMPKTV